MTAEIDRHILVKYDIKRRIGKGAYGIVWKSVDRRTGEIVALKKIFDAFANSTDAQRTFREILFLQAFSNHPNVIQLINVIRSSTDKDIYLVFEFMDTDLHAVIKSKILQSVHMQYIMSQLCRVLKYIHSGNVIHRDLKPSNILINSECFIKLADFGLARSLASTSNEGSKGSGGDGVSDFNPAMTDYVATRWYRSPEILLGSRRYTRGVDMWSLGCILAEMIASKPLYPGSSTINQLDRIMSTLPPPSRQDVESIKSPYAKAILDQIIHKRHKYLTDILPQADDISLDLLNKLLNFNPNKRLTAANCLEHPYLSKFHDSDKEPVIGCQIVPVIDDNVQLTAHEYREQLYKDIVLRHTELHPQSPKPASPAPPPNPDVLVEDCELESCISDHSLAQSEREKREKKLKEGGGGYVSHSSPSLPVKKTSDESEGGGGVEVKSRAFIPFMNRSKSTAVQARGGIMARPSTPLQTHSRTTVQPLSRARIGCASASHITTKKPTPPPHPPPPHSTHGKPIDLTVTSARIVPISRPPPPSHQWKEVNRRVSRGGPSRYASGTYTQTHGVIRRSDLMTIKQNNW